MKLEDFLTSYMKKEKKILSKWVRGLNIRPESIELLEENIGRTLCL